MDGSDEAGDYHAMLEYSRSSSMSMLPISGEKYSKTRRLLIVGSAVLACLLNSGIAFGFSALLPALVRNGAFHDLCDLSQRRLGARCAKQTAALTGMFTLTTSSLNLAAMPTGYIIDHLGPRATATIALIVESIGVFAFAHGGDGPLGHAAYFGGFWILGVAGPAVLNSAFSFANLFPGKEGFITASMVGSFDAASSVFVVLAGIMRRGVSFYAVFASYSMVPIVAAVAAFLLWPEGAVEKSLKGSIRRRMSEQATMVDVPSSSQMRSPEYCFAVYVCSVHMLCINHFIATSFLQMQEVNPRDAEDITTVFSVLLPLGGVVYIPLIGAILSSIGVTKSFTLLTIAMLSFYVLLAVHAVSNMRAFGFLAFVVFAFCRPMFYTLGATFVGQQFGFATFGRLYGSLTTICGVANLIGQPLAELGQAQGFSVANAVLVLLQLTTLAFPVMLIRRRQRIIIANQLG